MLINSHTIFLLDLLIIIIVKYCITSLKCDDDFVRSVKTNKTPEQMIIKKPNKLILFVLEQLHIIKQSNDFKTLKSKFIQTNKIFPKNIKDWLCLLCIILHRSRNNIKKGLFSHHFKIDTPMKELNLNKNYKFIVNFILKLNKKSKKVNILESNNLAMSIIFNTLFYPLSAIEMKNNLITGGTPFKDSSTNKNSKLHTTFKKIITKNKNIQTLQHLVQNKKKMNNYIKQVLKLNEEHNTTSKIYEELWNNLFNQVKDILPDFKKYLYTDVNNIEDLVNKIVNHKDKELCIFAMLLTAWTNKGDVYIKPLINSAFKDRNPKFTSKMDIFIEQCWLILNAQISVKIELEQLTPYILKRKYCIMLTYLANKFFAIVKEQFTGTELRAFFGTSENIINIITSVEHFLIPQSSSFDLESACLFLNYGKTNVLGMYEFMITTKTPQLYIPVTINLLNSFSGENETLLIPSTYNLTPELKDTLLNLKVKQTYSLANLKGVFNDDKANDLIDIPDKIDVKTLGSKRSITFKQATQQLIKQFYSAKVFNNLINKSDFEDFEDFESLDFEDFNPFPEDNKKETSIGGKSNILMLKILNDFKTLFITT